MYPKCLTTSLAEAHISKIPNISFTYTLADPRLENALPPTCIYRNFPGSHAQHRRFLNKH